MLRDLQRRFASAVFDDDTTLAGRIQPGIFPAERRLQIYKNNILGSLTTALGAIYPVTEKLVGGGFFGYAADEYLRAHRPVSASLHDFGGAFAGFLAAFEPAASLPYLPDVARLEWAWHRAFHAAGAGPIDATRLATVPEDRHPQLRFVLHPSASLIESAYPVVRIFAVHQEDFAGELAVDLEAGGVTALVIRRGLTVQVEPLAAGEAALLTALHRNRTLADAVEAALAHEPDFDLAGRLADHLRRGTFAQILDG